MFCFLQVRKLEQENKLLETKWQLLQKETEPESQLEPMLKSYITSLCAQLERVNKDREHLDAELSNAHEQIEEQKQRSVITHFIFSPEPTQNQTSVFSFMLESAQSKVSVFFKSQSIFFQI